jgi:hypothetical protein
LSSKVIDVEAQASDHSNEHVDRRINLRHYRQVSITANTNSRTDAESPISIPSPARASQRSQPIQSCARDRLRKSIDTEECPQVQPSTDLLARSKSRRSAQPGSQTGTNNHACLKARTVAHPHSHNTAKEAFDQAEKGIFLHGDAEVRDTSTSNDSWPAGSSAQSTLASTTGGSAADPKLSIPTASGDDE